MSAISVILVSLGLCLDNMAVAFAGGCADTPPSLKQTVKVASAFMLAHLLMFSIGWFGGEGLTKFLGNYAYLLSFIILLFIGLKNIKGSFSAHDSCRAGMFDSLKSLLIVSLATSIDALAVGVSLSMTGKVSLAAMLTTLAAFVFFSSLIGFKAGNKIGMKIGGKAGIISGIILIAVGAKILLEGIK